MSTSKVGGLRRRIGLAVAFSGLLFAAAPAFAGIAGSVIPSYPTPIKVGDNKTATITITNASSGTQASENVIVSNIFFTPSCQHSNNGLSCSSDDLDVFQYSTVQGEVGSACEGIVFTKGVPNAVTGEFQLNPQAATVILGPANGAGPKPKFCIIDLNFHVVRTPLDSSPPNPPITTDSLGHATLTGTVSTNLSTTASGGAQVEVTPAADLVISKTDGVTTVNAGGSTIYTLTVVNNGPSEVTSALVNDPGPSGITLGAWTCSTVAAGSGGVVTTGCGTSSGSGPLVNVPVTLKVGGSVAFVVNASITATTGTVTNTASVQPPAGTIILGTSCVSDATITRSFVNPVCSSSDTDNVQPVADLAVTKSDGVTTYLIGGQLVYTIVVSNAGPSDAIGSLVTDNIPPQFSSWAWACTGTSGGATGCDPAPSNAANFTDTVNLPANSSITYTVTAQVSGTATGDLVNTVNVAVPAGTNDSNPNNNTATDTDKALPTLTKSFNPNTFAVGGFTTLTFTITNPATNNPARVVSFTDTLPAGLLVASSPTVVNNCTGGTVTANAGANTITVSGTTVGASTASATACTIAVNVTNVALQVNPSCTSAPNFTNTSANIGNLQNLNNGVQPSCVTVTPLTPGLDKAFNPNTFVVNGFTTLTFTITNPAANNPQQVVSFTDTLPAGLLVASSPTVVNNCTGGTVTANAGATTITVTGTTVAASNASPTACTIAVNVTNVPLQVNPSCTNAPNFTNTSANISGLQNLLNQVNPSCVTVTPKTPGLDKSFNPNTFVVNGFTTLTFTITNPAVNNPQQVVSFTDTLPAGLLVANPANVVNNCAGGTVTANAGGGTITVTGTTVAASNASPTACTIAVNVTNVPLQLNPSCTSAPNFTNTSANISGLQNLLNQVNPSCVTVTPLTPGLDKAFSPNTFVVNGFTTLTFTITNPAVNNPQQVVSFTDTLPTGLLVANPANVVNNCSGGTVTANPGAGAITVTGTTVGASNASPTACTIAVNVTNVPLQVNPSCTSAPNFTNTSANISGLQNLLNQVNPSCVTVTPLTPGLDKSFNPTTFVVNGFTTLTFTITNPAVNNPQQVVSFTDTLPAGLLVANPANVVNNCGGGTVTATAGSNTITVTGTTVAASNASPTACTIAVNVTNVPLQVNPSCTSAPNFTNTSANISGLQNLLNQVNPSCVTVTPLTPGLDKSFNPTTFVVNGFTTLTFTITNPAVNNPQQVVSFTDTLPTGLLVANPANVVNNCSGGTVTANPGAGAITVTGTTVGASNASPTACTIAVNVTNVPLQVNPSCTSAPNFTNTSANISGLQNLLNQVNPSCVTVTPKTPGLDKSFNPTTFVVNGFTTLTFTITNPAVNNPQQVVSFTDTLPAGLLVANPANVVNNCSGGTVTANPGAGAITVTGTTVGASNASPTACTIAVNVTNVPLQVNPSCTSAPNFTNTSANISGLQNLLNQVNPSCVTVTPLTPGLDKSFNPTTFVVNGSTTLTFTITNPAVNNPAQVVSFTDTLPTGLQVASSPTVVNNCGGGTVTANAGAGTITVTGTTVAASNASPTACTIAVNVTNVPLQVNPSCPAPNFTNSSANITSLQNLLNQVNASCVTVTPLTPTLTKSFSPNQFFPGGFTTLTFTITNPAVNNPQQVVSFTDTLPTGLQVASSPTVVNNCGGGTVTATAGASTITVSGTTVGASNASPTACTIAVNVTNVAGQINPSCNGNPSNFTNTSTNISNLQNLINGVQPSCVTIPGTDLVISKTDGTLAVAAGASTVYTIVVSNNGPSPANNAVVIDPAVTGLTKTEVACGTATGGAVCPTLGGTAAARVTAIQAGVTIATFPANSSLTFTITATVSATSGQVTNTATVTPPAGVPNTGSSCTTLSAPNARSFNAGTGACSASDTDNVIPASCFLGNPQPGGSLYPYTDASHPLTSTTFSESTVLKKSEPTIALAGGTIRVWYSDEHALALGIRQVTGGSNPGTFPVTTFPPTNAAMIAFGAPSGTLALSAGVDANGNPVPAYTGGPNLPLTTGATACPGGCDSSQRPVAPALFCTDITASNTNRGDWQIVGGTGGFSGTKPDFVSGTWKSATSAVAAGVPTTAVDGDPSANVTNTNTPVWVAGPNADVPTGGYSTLKNAQSGNQIESYGAEVRWNVDSSTIQCYDALGNITVGLTPGHLYRVQFLIHDGDQNKTGGDAGEACAIIAR